MKQHLSMAAAVLLALGAASPGQNADPLATSAAAPQNEMQKWLATLDAQWQEVFAREVTGPTEAEQGKLWVQYLGSIEAAITKASSAGNLDLTVVWRNERERVARAKDVPTEDEPGAPSELKQLRAGWRTQNAKINRDRAEHAKAVLARYDQVLAQAQTQLTQRQRIDDALLVKAKREEIAAAWLTPAIAAPRPAIAAPQITQMTALQNELADTKWRINQDKTFMLHADGSSTSSWTPRKGHWKVIDGTTVEMDVSNVPSKGKVSVSQGGTLMTWLGREKDQQQVAKKMVPIPEVPKPAVPATKVPSGTKPGPAVTEENAATRHAMETAIIGIWTWKSTDSTDRNTIDFYKDGTGSHGARNNTKWEVTGDREITITHPGKGTAVIRLNISSMTFTGTGYNGKPVSGRPLR